MPASAASSPCPSADRAIANSPMILHTAVSIVAPPIDVPIALRIGGPPTPIRVSPSAPLESIRR